MAFALPAAQGLPVQQHVERQAARLHVAGLANRRQAAPSRVSVKVQSAAGTFGQEGAGSAQISFRGEPASASTNVSSSAANSKAVLEDVRLFLQAELPGLFSSGRITKERYASDFKFEDPVTRVTGLDQFASYLQLLRSVFAITFDVHSIKPKGATELVTRWTMTMKFKLGFAIYRPELVFTGQSFYGVDANTGIVRSQLDVWDATSNNTYPSLEGLAHVLRQLGNYKATPDLEGPRYKVLRSTKEYEIRKYDSYMVAETAMPMSSGPAEGSGFQDLANYIFGGNDRQESMEMTSPVINTINTDGSTQPQMQFPMEAKYGQSLEALPNPSDGRVRRRLQEGGLVAATTFSGLPLDFEVTEAERKLRGALLLDGVQASSGYKLARYNDPFTLPFVRRNEVLIRLDDFQLDDSDKEQS
ncbi:hypothetical protein WJX74_002802 [Apatococcus lobatus]|uniref:SOUL heme-binding protein n=1 Tax=Apatococcus lobatus TaxID=904363 RepID=A0AAW1RH31_9CHLO